MVEVQSIEEIRESDVTDDLARESGFADAADLMATARHGSGQTIYLIRFRYLPPGAGMFDAAPPPREQSRRPRGRQGSKR